jgi:hypothetical protein
VCVCVLSTSVVCISFGCTFVTPRPEIWNGGLPLRCAWRLDQKIVGARLVHTAGGATMKVMGRHDESDDAERASGQ